MAPTKVSLISFLRTVPPVDKPNGLVEIKTLAKVLDRQGKFVMDVARHINHEKIDLGPPPTPTVAYGTYVTRMCTGCHGETLSGGPIPGAPPSFPAPLNLTPHETGLKGWTYDDFNTLLTKATRKNGQQLKPFMPIESFGRMDETEKKAIFAYLQSVPPIAYGNR